MFKVTRSFDPLLSLCDLGRLIESSLGSVATKLNFFIHNLAQMKFASSEDRPTLSFAPRVHTVKSDGLIRSLYICRHLRTSTSKGYVSPAASQSVSSVYLLIRLIRVPKLCGSESSSESLSP